MPQFEISWRKWAPVVARILIAMPFAVGALFKIPGSEMFGYQVAATAQVGVPFAAVAVFLAFILEVIAAIALVLGYRVRLVAGVLVFYVLLLTALFHMDRSAPDFIPQIMSHICLLSALLYASAYGASVFALRKDD